MSGTRVAVMVHGELLQWQAQALRCLSDLGQVEPVAVVRSADRTGAIPTLLGHQPILDVVELPRGWGHVPTTDVVHGAQAASWLADHRPDVLLVFGAPAVSSELAAVAVHGAWAFHFGPPGVGYPVPVLFEAITERPLAHAYLVRLSAVAAGASHILREAVVGADGDVLERVPELLELVLRWPTDVVRQLRATGGVPDLGQWTATDGAVPSWPGKAARSRFRLKRWMERLRLWRRPTVDQGEWNIGVLQQPISDLLDPEGSRGVRWLPAPSAIGSRATPFGYVHDGRLNVLFEKSEVHDERRVIARLRPRADNVLKRSRTMLDIGRAITYPYIVEHDGTVYVVLDHPTDGNVVLYRVTADNDALDRVTTLIDEPLTGATLFPHEGRWWLMGTRAPQQDASLFVYWSDRIEGPFIPHVLNPVKTDVRSARPAGTPFVHDGRLWRPAQDRTPGTNVQVVFNEVLALTPGRFHEVARERLGLFTHTAYAKGMRTVSAVGGMTVVDGLRDRVAAAKQAKRGGRSGGPRKTSNQDS